MGIELKPEVVDALKALAAAEGLSLEDYLETLVKQKEPGMSADRSSVVEAMLALQKNVKPDPDGLTVRDYINFGRR